MESAFLVMFFVCLLFSSSFSMPILSEVKVERKSENTPTVLKLPYYQGLSPDDGIKLLSSSTETVLEVFTYGFEAGHVKRVTRDVVNPGERCPSDRIEYGGRCLTKKEYDEYNEVSDYEAER